MQVSSDHLSAPVLSLTIVGLELIPDADMYLFLGKSMRGGVSYISERYSKASNKYLKCYDPKQNQNLCKLMKIMYFDANNLYGYAMSNYFPADGFKWIDP